MVNGHHLSLRAGKKEISSSLKQLLLMLIGKLPSYLYGKQNKKGSWKPVLDSGKKW